MWCAQAVVFSVDMCPKLQSGSRLIIEDSRASEDAGWPSPASITYARPVTIPPWIAHPRK
jgi:hypothetical protein